MYSIERINWLIRMLDIPKRYIAKELGLSVSSLYSFLQDKTTRHTRIFQIACTSFLNTYMDNWNIEYDDNPFDGCFHVIIAGIDCVCFD